MEKRDTRSADHRNRRQEREAASQPETVKPGEPGTVQSESFLEPQAPPSARDSEDDAPSQHPRPAPPTPEVLPATSAGVGVDQGPSGRVPQRPGQDAEFTGSPGARPDTPRNVTG